MFSSLWEKIRIVILPIVALISGYFALQKYPIIVDFIAGILFLLVLITVYEVFIYYKSYKISIEKVDDETLFREILQNGRDNYRKLGNNYPEDEGPVLWWKTNNAGVYVLFSYRKNEKKPLVFFATYPVTYNYYLGVLKNKLDEDDLCPSYMIKSGEKAKYWYIGDIGRMKKEKTNNGEMLAIFSNYLISTGLIPRSLLRLVEYKNERIYT